MPDSSLILPGLSYSESMEISDATIVKKSTALSGRIYARTVGAQLFTVTLKFARQPLDNLAATRAFLTRRSGGSGIFYIRIEQPNQKDRLAPGNYVNSVQNPDGKLYMIENSSASLYAPSLPAGQTASSGPAYIRCSLTSKGIRSMIDHDGLDGFSITVEERI